MKRFFVVLTAATFAALGSGALAGAASAAPATGQISIVQALPGEKVGVAVSGRTIDSAAATGSVLGPFTLSAGTHRVTFTSHGKKLTTAVDVTGGAVSDVVLHLPAQAEGAPVVNTYQVPLTPIGSDKSRVLLAHTATVGAVDITVNSKKVFSDVANGQFAKADVPAGEYKVALQDITSKKTLGAFDVPLAPATLTMVYAYAEDGQMKTIVDTRKLKTDGVTTPTVIHTGSAGLADGGVSTFGLDSGSAPSVALGIGTFATVAMVALIGTRARRRTTLVTVSRRTY